MSRATQEKLRDYVRAGGNLIYGPVAPRLDENLQPCGILAEVQPPFTAEPSGPEYASLLSAELTHTGVRPAAERDDPALDVVVHTLPDGRRVLFAANPTAEERRARIQDIGAPFDPSTPTPGPDGRVPFSPYSVGIWEAAS
jgi:hypothetical protein